VKRMRSTWSLARRWGPFLPATWLVMIAVGGLVAAVGVLVLRYGSSTGGNQLKGWSTLDWTVKYDGYGHVGAEDGAASLEPRAVKTPSQTSAALALAGNPDWHDYVFTVRMKLQRQLRQNSSPNPWETGWLMFRYEGEGRSYYLAHKTNGLELGKLVSPAGKGQKFLVTKPSPPAVPGRWYGYRIEVRGPTIKVYVDSELRISYTDPNPILSGRVGLYTEDAHVLFRDPHIHVISAKK
jgi:hypothetical protein